MCIVIVSNRVLALHWISINRYTPSTSTCSDINMYYERCDLSTDVPKLRLAEGPNKFQGRLEMEVAGTWGTICDDNFSYTAAAVVCRQMGLPL